MKAHTRKPLFNRWSKTQKTVVGIVFGLIIVSSGILTDFAAHAAAANNVYFAPSGGTYNIGDTVSVAVRENSASTGVYSAQIGFSYPQSQLQYVSTDGNGSAFPIDTGLGKGGSGQVTVIRGSTTAITNDQLIANVTFKVLASGTAALTFNSACQGSNTTNCDGVYDVNTNNIISSQTNASFTLNAPSTGGGTGTGSGSGSSSGGGSSSNPSSNPSSTPTSTPASTPTTSNPSAAKSTTSVAITPQSSLTPITAPDTSQVQVSTPVTVQPATIQPDGVKKVQYYLNNKLVYTANDVPYTYQLHTQSLLNGTYTLKTISYYESGRTSTSTQKLIVSNPLSWTQFRLLAQHYAALIITPLAIILVVLVAWIYRKHFINWMNGPHNLNGGGHGSGSGGKFKFQTPPNVISPNAHTSILSPEPATVPIRVDDEF